MNLDAFTALTHTQRAHRSFADQPLDDALVARLIDAATRAPSAENSQPWVFVVVRDPEARAAIGDLTRRAWEGGGRAFSESRLDPQLLADVHQSATGGFAHAPVHVVVGGDTTHCVPQVLEASVMPAVQNLLLAATVAGLASALTTITTRFADELRALTALPESVRPVAVVPLGWPIRTLGPNRRRPVADVAYRERFGTPFA